MNTNARARLGSGIVEPAADTGLIASARHTHPMSAKESMEERIQREKRERYEASEEYKQLQADKQQNEANISLASSTQVRPHVFQLERLPPFSPHPLGPACARNSGCL